MHSERTTMYAFPASFYPLSSAKTTAICSYVIRPKQHHLFIPANASEVS
jgi:hypothetical protein